jgi:fumarate reductase flavoprotein subunit
VYIAMSHLGPDNVRRQFKGMVERCADCGFDLAGGRVEVVPTAHYMMGGVEFATDCTTEREGVYVAGEDSGGVHGANRLGGNGVANSTVFGGIAGETMAKVRRNALRDPDGDAILASLGRALRPFDASGGASELEAIRDRLHAVMWDDAGIIRDAEGLARADHALLDLAGALDRYRLPAAARDRRFNMTWHDWLNLANLVCVSQVIVRAARARENSRGAHFRADFPDAGDLSASTYTRVRARPGGGLDVEAIPVRFTRVRPGESLI